MRNKKKFVAWITLRKRFLAEIYFIQCFWFCKALNSRRVCKALSWWAFWPFLVKKIWYWAIKSNLEKFAFRLQWCFAALFLNRFHAIISACTFTMKINAENTQNMVENNIRVCWKVCLEVLESSWNYIRSTTIQATLIRIFTTILM